MWKLDPILVPWKWLPTLLFTSAILLWWHYKCHVWVTSDGKWNFKSFPWIFLVELSLPKKTSQGYLRQEPNVQYLDPLFKATNICMVSNLPCEPLRNRHLILLCAFGNVPSDLGFDITVKRPRQFKVTLLSNRVSLNLFQWEEILSQLSSCETELDEHSPWSNCNTKLLLRNGICWSGWLCTGADQQHWMSCLTLK